MPAPSVLGYFNFMAAHHAYPRLIQSMVARDGEVREIAQRHLLSLHEWLAAGPFAWLPPTGATSAHHFIITFSGAVLDYFAYAPGLAATRPGGLLSPPALEERRAHLRFLVDALMDRLGPDPGPDLGPDPGPDLA